MVLLIATRSDINMILLFARRGMSKSLHQHANASHHLNHCIFASSHLPCRGVSAWKSALRVTTRYPEQLIMDNGTTPTCYAVNGNIIKPESLLLPCGGSSTNNTFCCVQGHICTEDAICRFTETIADTSLRWGMH